MWSYIYAFSTNIATLRTILHQSKYISWSLAKVYRYPNLVWFHYVHVSEWQDIRNKK